MSAMKRAAALRLAAAAALLAAAGCASAPAPARDCIPQAEMPDPLRWLPPPPAEGSAAKAFDRARQEEARALRAADPARAERAVRDAPFTWENFWDMVSPAYGRAISEAETPALCAMLRFGLESARRSGKPAKVRYARVRPFAELGEPSLLPADEPFLARNGSYPSGHALNGWTAALLLSEVAPHRAEPILARGLEIGDSRVVAGVHWQSDVDAARLVAAAAVARLHADPDFCALLAAAKREAAAAPPPSPEDPATEQPATGENP